MNPNRIFAKIQNRKNLGGSGRFAVVDSERKSFREQAMESKMFGMDSVEKSQALDVLNRFFEETIFLMIVLTPAGP